MERRFVLRLIAIAGLAALFHPPIGRAAGDSEERAPGAAAGTILTVAGTGRATFSGDGGPATQAGLYYPLGIALDAAGNL
jgi:hypothetical protein